jgi:hypothetical protein
MAKKAINLSIFLPHFFKALTLQYEHDKLHLEVTFNRIRNLLFISENHFSCTKSGTLLNLVAFSIHSTLLVEFAKTT